MGGPGGPDHAADSLRLGLLLTHQRPAAGRRPAAAGVDMPENG
jgi:hypothetical protein